MTQWTLHTVRLLLDQATATIEAGGKQAADRLIEHGQLHSALSWLTTKHAADAKLQTELMTLVMRVLNNTRLFSSTAEPGASQHYSIRHRAGFDQSIRALKAYVNRLADTTSPANLEPSTDPE